MWLTPKSKLRDCTGQEHRGGLYDERPALHWREDAGLPDSFPRKDMNMATIAQTTPNSRVYNALYDDAHGYLTMDTEGVIWFRNSATDALTIITTANFEAVLKLGEVGLCETQALRDYWRGGPARIACSRQMEVA
jgi:hypothetical protein